VNWLKDIYPLQAQRLDWADWGRLHLRDIEIWMGSLHASNVSIVPLGFEFAQNVMGTCTRYYVTLYNV